MDVRILHMNGGDGRTSYSKNSGFQKKILSLTKTITQSAAVEFYCAYSPVSLNVADLGCSSGPNALAAVSDVVEAVEERRRLLGRPAPDFQLLLNDLPTNDFNSVFSLLPDLYKRWGFSQGRCFVYGVPGSFYGRLFAATSLHIVHSSMSLHWLSQVPELKDGSDVPLNPGKVHISRTSDPRVPRAYLMQFQSDFSLFLDCRCKEMVTGGRMILTFRGRRNPDPATEENSYGYELLSNVLCDMASEGLVSQEDVDTFNLPFYAPSTEELRNLITAQGYFDIDILDAVEISSETYGEGQCDRVSASADSTARTLRAVLEPMLASHFGEQVMEELFKRYRDKFEEYYSRNKAMVINIIMSLVKK